MFAQFSERSMIRVRWALVLCWALLIGSLVWDPISPQWTAPGENGNILAADYYTVEVQGRTIEEQPYSIGPRAFWAMIVPLVPIFLLIFGHEAWRRICPLAAIHQIPRRLGFQSSVSRLNRTTGRIERRLNLVPGASWLQRHHWEVQVGFLFFGLVCRILFVNSDVTALFLFFAGVIIASLLVGYFYGGKTWCNYVCPIAVIQRMYTGPGGLLESKAHIDKPKISKSTCRVQEPDGERSACVACTSPCPDIDLERSYWDTLMSPGRRFMYYAFPGLVFGFYAYFYVYSGNWNYYFSSAWSHEESQLQDLLAPGIYWQGVAINIPKFIAAPSFIFLTALLSFGVFLLIEKLLSVLFSVEPASHSDQILRHRMYTLLAFISINIYYTYGGRATVLLGPEWLVRTFDIFIIFVTTSWLWVTWRREPDLYRREAQISSLRRELTDADLPIDKLLDGRRIEELSADEAFVAARVAAGASELQKQNIYKNLLREALENGEWAERRAGGLFDEMRRVLDLTQANHQDILDRLRREAPHLFDPSSPQNVEQRLRRDNYKEAVVNLVGPELTTRPNAEIASLLDQTRVLGSDVDAAAFYGIDEQERSELLAEIDADRNRPLHVARAAIAELRVLATRRHALREEVGPDGLLISRELARRVDDRVSALIGALVELGEDERGVLLAADAFVLAEDRLTSCDLETEALAPRVAHALRARAVGYRHLTYADVVATAPDRLEVLQAIATEEDGPTIVAALAISALSRAQPDRAQALWRQARLAAPASGSAMQLSADVAATIATGDGAATVETIFDLSTVALFRELALDELTALAVAAQRQTIQKDVVVCALGEPADAMYVVLSGGLEAWLPRDDGRQTLGAIGPGDVFGELGVVARASRTASVSVVSKAATILRLPGETVIKLIERRPRIALSLSRVIASYVLRTTAGEPARP